MTAEDKTAIAWLRQYVQGIYYDYKTLERYINRKEELEEKRGEFQKQIDANNKKAPHITRSFTEKFGSANTVRLVVIQRLQELCQEWKELCPEAKAGSSSDTSYNLDNLFKITELQEKIKKYDEKFDDANAKCERYEKQKIARVQVDAENKLIQKEIDKLGEEYAGIMREIFFLNEKHLISKNDAIKILEAIENLENDQIVAEYKEIFLSHIRELYAGKGGKYFNYHFENLRSRVVALFLFARKREKPATSVAHAPDSKCGLRRRRKSKVATSAAHAAAPTSPRTRGGARQKPLL